MDENEIKRLIARSSLGSHGARRLIAQVAPGDAALTLRRARELGDSGANTESGPSRVRLGEVTDTSTLSNGLRRLLIAEPSFVLTKRVRAVHTLINDPSVCDVVLLPARTLADGSSPYANAKALSASGHRVCAIDDGWATPDEVLRLTRAGALGFARATDDLEKVVATIRVVASGKSSLANDSEWASTLLADPHNPSLSLDAEAIAALSSVAAGLSADDIAEQRHLNRDVVIEYVERIRVRYAAAVNTGHKASGNL